MHKPILPKAKWALSEVAAIGLLLLGMVVMTRRLVAGVELGLLFPYDVSGTAGVRAKQC